MTDRLTSSGDKYLKKQDSCEGNDSNVVSKSGEDEQQTVSLLYTIRISRGCEISICKSLIPLRLSLFLWYGAARVPVSYLSVFMKQKGLSLVEYSSIFSVTFVFQFLTAFLSGITADKIGNAKPVLIFHILITMLSILSFLLIPRIDNNCDFSVNNKSPDYKINITNVTMKSEDINATLSYDVSRTILFDERNISDNNSFTVNNSAGIVGLMCDKYKDNCTSPQDTIRNECGSHQEALLILHVVTTVIFLSSWSSVYRFMDVTVMSLVQKYDTNFGYERFFSISGDLVITFITGMVLYSFTSASEENNYSSVYWSSLSMLGFVLVAVYFVETEVKLPAQNMWKEGFILLRNIDNLVFILVILLLGTYSCFFDNFILLFLERINANTVVMGLQQTFNALYGLPFFITSKWWLEVFGPKNLFILAFLGYTIYGAGYSFLYNPWFCLLIEASSSLTYHLLWVAVVTHSHQIAPRELVSTVIATAGAVHFGIGRSTGSVTGGFLIDAVGPRITFRIFAGVSSVAAALYATFLYFRRSTAKMER